MNYNTPIYITFRNYQVAVQSNSSEFLSKARSLFQHLLTPEPTQIIKQFEIDYNHDQFYLIEEAQVEDHGALSEILCRLKYEVVTCLVQACADLLWFHSGAVAYENRAILLPGEGGKGKSTLVTRLCAQGWQYLSEDVVAIDLNSGVALPFPQMPRVRDSVGRQLSLEQVLALDKTEVYLPAEKVCFHAVPIHAIVFPSYGFQSIDELMPCSLGAAVLKLFQNCMNFAEHRQTAIRDSCTKLKNVSTFCLSFSDRDRATKLIIDACVPQSCMI